jgi:hypothetical protein
MRKLVLLFPLLLSACAQPTSAPDTNAAIHEPTVQMTMVATSLNSWPYAAPITFAIPDTLLYGKEQGKPWLPLFQSAARDYLQALGMHEAPPEQANVLVAIGVLGEKEDAEGLLFSKLGMDPGVTVSKKGTVALIIKDRQSDTKLWSAALQASSDMPIKATEARDRTAKSLIQQMMMRLPPAQ